MKRPRHEWILLAALSLTGCASAGLSTNKVSTQGVWPLRIGDVTVLQDVQNPNFLTTISVEQPTTRLCEPESVKVVDVHMTKNADAAYWNIGMQSSLHFLMATDPDRTIRAIGLIADSENAGGGSIWLTDQIFPQNGQLLPAYLMLRPSVSDGEFYQTPDRELEFSNEYIAACAFTDPGLEAQGDELQPSTWETKWVVTEVDTPIYKGPAIAVTYSQGVGAIGSAPYYCNGTNPWSFSEVWYFAMDRIHGLVEIQGDVEGTFSGPANVAYPNNVCPLTPPLTLKAISFKAGAQQ